MAMPNLLTGSAKKNADDYFAETDGYSAETDQKNVFFRDFFGQVSKIVSFFVSFSKIHFRSGAIRSVN